MIGRLPGEHSCLSLVWAVLDRASAGWRGFATTTRRTAFTGRPAPHPAVTHQPNSTNRTHHQTPKPESHQPNPSPSHSITRSGRYLQAIYTGNGTTPGIPGARPRAPILVFPSSATGRSSRPDGVGCPPVHHPRCEGRTEMRYVGARRRRRSADGRRRGSQTSSIADVSAALDLRCGPPPAPPPVRPGGRCPAPLLSGRRGPTRPAGCRRSRPPTRRRAPAHRRG